MSNPMDAYLKSKKSQTVLLGPLERHLLLNPRDEGRRTDVLHPSAMCKEDWCLRESWFLLNGWEPEPETIGFRLRSIFDEGHAIHAKWQGWLSDMDVLKGKWECRDHGKEWFGLRSSYPAHADCEGLRYKEVPIINAEHRIAGHADGWVILDDQYLLEIKSIGTGTIRAGGGKLSPKGLEASFRYITSPYRPHVRQAMLYLWCLKQMYADAPDKILFIYECKANQEPKEFVVKYHEEWVEDVLELLASFDIDSDEPPPCNVDPDGCSKCRRYA